MAPSRESAVAELPAVVLERRGAVALITLNRPQSMNAVDARLSKALGDALAELAGDPGLRVGS